MDKRLNVSASDKDKIISAGIDWSQEQRSGSFFQQGADVLFSQSFTKEAEILSTDRALEKFPEVRKYKGRAFSLISKSIPGDTQGGYFIRVRKGRTVELPIQACLFIKSKKTRQRVHNIIIVEEGARVYIITGCASAESADKSFHLGLSEFFVEKGGYLNFTMIHSWKDDTVARPVSAAVLEEGASFVSNYICLKPVREIKMYPVAVIQGRGARASFNSLLMAHPGSVQDVGARVIFRRAGRAEIISRAVSLGGRIIARGHLKAEAEKVRAHLECRGLVLAKKGVIHAVPELETEFQNVDLSHEAAIGKISREEIEYLCSRGLSQQQAQSVIIRGFMDIEILSLPEIIKQQIRDLENTNFQGSL